MRCSSYGTAGVNGFFFSAIRVALQVIPSRGVKIAGLLGPAAAMDKKSSSVADTHVGIGGTNQWRLAGLVSQHTCHPCTWLPMLTSNKYSAIFGHYQNMLCSHTLRLSTYAREQEVSIIRASSALIPCIWLNMLTGNKFPASAGHCQSKQCSKTQPILPGACTSQEDL